MADYLLTNGAVVTQNADRECLQDGAVAVEDGEITGVGPTSELREEVDAAETIDASGGVVLPGFVDAHVHVSDILLRGYTGEERELFDWLHNVKTPGVAAMDREDHRIAAALFCREALRAGVTTFVENDLGAAWSTEATGPKLGVYDEAGIRCIYARGVLDQPSPGPFGELKEHKQLREPGVDHVPEQEPPPAAEQLDAAESLIRERGGGDRLSVWLAPAVVEGVSTDTLRRAADLAAEYGVMTTTHVSESPFQEHRLTSTVEYLDDIGYLGERTLLGHCVHLSERDVRLLAATDTRVSHNLLTNLRLGSGIAPLREMRARGVPVAIGTDNATLSDTVNPLNDARYAALVHKGYHEDPGVVTAQEALDMITIEAARAIRREDDLGSIEVGKRADLVVLDTAHPHLTPSPDPIDAVVYGAGGHEIDTVFCDGEPVVRDGVVRTLTESYPDLLDRATEAAADLVERTGIAGTRER